jgi:hypothetical protein
VRKLCKQLGLDVALPAFTCLSEPRTTDKQDLIDMEELGLIDGLGGFAESATAKFLRHLTAAQAAA